LRKKIGSLGGPDVQRLIKTEFRRGYMFVGDVSFGAPVAPPPVALPLRARSA
jgi:DNA-binding winged helix-turn-helix (wHTH) protein